MKKIFSFVLLISSLLFSNANASSQDFDVYLITHFQAPLGEFLGVDVQGTVDGNLSGGVFSNDEAHVTLKPYCNSDKSCEGGDAYLLFTYSPQETPLCKYEFNIITQKGYFSIRNQFQPIPGGKPVTCYASLVGNQLYIFVRDVK